MTATTTPDQLSSLLDHTPTSTGESLLALSAAAPDRDGLLLVFLRHFGCTFCREALADVARIRPRLAERRVRLALVHMVEPALGHTTLARYHLADVPHVSDPQRRLYQAFGLARGRLGQLFGLKCLARGIRAGLIDGHLVGGLAGDGFQMPGVFLIRDGRVVSAFIHQSAADRPDYLAIAACPLPAHA